jgi:hypothetical protein
VLSSDNNASFVLQILQQILQQPERFLNPPPSIPASILKGDLKILPHHPKTKAEKTLIDSPFVVHELTADAHAWITPAQEIFKDARGFTYKSVRFCDLDRICDK